jgi:RNA recognition motif-containing protein
MYQTPIAGSNKGEIKMKLYVGNLGSTFTDVQLQSLFAQHGSVQSAKMIRDQHTGQTRGFGFVEMADAEAKQAMELLNGKDVEGRPLTVNEARPQRQRSDGGSRGGFHRRSY